MIFQSSLGINISDDYVSFAFLKDSFKGAVLKAHAVYNLEKEKPLKDRIDTAGDLAVDFMQRHNIISADIFLGIPGRLVIFKEIEFPFAVKENIKETLSFEVEKYVPISANDIYFDFQITGEDKKSNRIKVLLAIAKKKTIEPYFELKNKIGAGISGIETASTGTANFFLNEKNIVDDTYAIAFSHGGTLDLSLIRNRAMVYSRSSSLATDNDNLENLLKNALQPLQKAAGEGKERISVKFCGSDNDRDTFDFIKKENGLGVNFVDFDKTRVPSGEIIPAFGVALKGLSRVCMQINLFPENFRKRPGRTGYYLMLLLAGLAFLFSLLWGGSSILRQQLYLKDLNSRIEQLITRIDDIDRIQSSSHKIEERIAYVTRLRNDRVFVLDILKELSSNIPETDWIQSFSFSEKGITIDGYAEAASELIPILESSSLFYDVVFLSTITKAKSGKEKYKIGLKAKPGG